VELFKSSLGGSKLRPSR
jgi:hypothetical protein